MEAFYKHKLEKTPEGNILYLYLHPMDAEFAQELGANNGNPQKMEVSIKQYVSTFIPGIKVNSVKILLGTLVVSSFAFNHAKSTSAAGEETPSSETAELTTYTVVSGDSLSVIAKKNGITTQALKEANHLLTDVIFIGQVLKIPASTVIPNAQPTTVSPSPEPAPVQTVTTESPSTVILAPSSSPNTSTYTVVSGDSLSLIAKRLNTTIDAIKSANNLTSDIIRVGQVLTIPAPMTTPTIPPVPTPTTTTITSYTVVSGDTLWKISTQFKTTIAAIKQANNLTTDVLQLGQKLIIPSGTNVVTPPPPTPVVQTTSYTVVSGDSLSVIAKKYNTSVDTIKSINGLTTDTIRVGQVLKVPTSTTVNPTTPEADFAAIQQDLKTLGYYAVTTMSGIADAATEAAVEAFQAAYGLPVSGTVDATTRTEIQHAIVKKKLVEDTKTYTGVPYKWGGMTPTGFDCSGFVYYMFNSHGVTMARNTSEGLYNQGKPIARANLMPGDLVFFGVVTPGKVSHVGFYLGGNSFVSATTSKGIWAYSLDHSYWSQFYMGAKRVY